jgi:hypothetical protein
VQVTGEKFPARVDANFTVPRGGAPFGEITIAVHSVELPDLIVLGEHDIIVLVGVLLCDVERVLVAVTVVGSVTV